ISYMTLWYLGVILLVVPMFLNAAQRALGDAKTPMRVMMFVALWNAVLDPMLIFGFGPIPPLGLFGASLATFLSRLFGCAYVLWTVARHTDLLVFEVPRPDALFASWRSVLQVGVPAVVTNALTPVSVAILTAIVAAEGQDALAAYGIGARIDALLLIVPFAVSGALSPYVGQNWAARLGKRVQEGVLVATRYATLWCVVVAVPLVFLPGPVVGLFTDSDRVGELLTAYLRILPLGYVAIAWVALASSTFNAADRAVRSTLLSSLRSLIFAIPAAYIGRSLLGLEGVFIGLVSSSFLAALVGARWLWRLLDEQRGPRGERGERIAVAEETSILDDPTLARSLLQGLPEVLSLEEMELFRVRRNATGFFAGYCELGHLHRDGRFDVPLPLEVGDNLVARGLVVPHRHHNESGWYTLTLRDPDDIPRALWLLRFTHLLYEFSQRGPGDPVTQAELAPFVLSARCLDAVAAATGRWGLALVPR
ncbi:MAG: MATE family efflux transporter, partial [Myxococcota bacterium]